MEKLGYRFSFGPWNIHEGADPFGPTVRSARTFDDKLKVYKKLDSNPPRPIVFHVNEIALAVAELMKHRSLIRTALAGAPW